MCCKKCWEAAAGGDPWGPDGLASPCGDQALYGQDFFDSLAVSNRQWTIPAPSTVSGGYLRVPDASVQHNTFQNEFTAFATGTGDFTIEAELSYLFTGNPTGGSYNLFGLRAGIGGGFLYRPSAALKNDGTCRITIDWAPSPSQILTMTAGVESDFVLRIERSAGTVSISLDGVVKHTIVSAVTYGLELETFTTNFPAAAPLSRQRWKSLKIVRC